MLNIVHVQTIGSCGETVSRVLFTYSRCDKPHASLYDF